jgi:hypothetical protein
MCHWWLYRGCFAGSLNLINDPSCDMQSRSFVSGAVWLDDDLHILTERHEEA